jgi:hypothetical protein
MHCRTILPLLCWGIFLLGGLARAEVQTKQIRILVSANETKGTNEANWTYAWALDGKWFRPGTDASVEVTLDSDYAHSDHSRVDRLRSAWRAISPQYGKEPGHWYPVVLVQTEGDHSFESLHTLVAAGFRQQQRYGFLEFTAGASKDVRTAESWVGDIGLAFAFSRKFNERWKISSGPKADYGAIGEVRSRDDRLRYSWDVNVNYQMTDKVGLGYRLWYGNTVPNSRRTQWVGLTLALK